MIKFPCPHCSANNEAEDADAGQTLLCGNCQGTVFVPMRARALPQAKSRAQRIADSGQGNDRWFEHPLNGHRIPDSVAHRALCCFFLGPLYPLICGCWRTALMYLIFGGILVAVIWAGIALALNIAIGRLVPGLAAIIAAVLAWYIPARMFASAMREEYLQRGWKSV